ncbi:MAG: hypothetical protein SCH39_01885 [Methanosarcinales archaeon]|nr:hypothetical protein [Methanosarcinales archaeon]
MIGIIPAAFEFLPIAILLCIFFLMVLFLKYVNGQNLRSVGSDICLGALFIQVTMLTLPVWTSGEMPINILVHIVTLVFTLFIWILSVWLLKRRKPSRKHSTNIIQNITYYFRKHSSTRESLSYILGATGLTFSLMMMFNEIDFGTDDWKLLITQFFLVVLTSAGVGYAGHGIYKYLQNEQYTHSFERFSNEITRDNVLLTVQSSGSQMHERDPVQPVVDIIRGSIMKDVLGPSMFGLSILKHKSIELMTASGMRKHNLVKVTLHFVGHIDDIGKLALRMDEDEAANETIETLGDIGKCAVTRGFDATADDILRRIFEYYDVLSLKNFEIMKITVTSAVSKIGNAAAAHSIDSTSSKAGNMLGIIGAAAIRSKEMDTLNNSINALYDIGREAAVHSVEGAVRKTALKLRDIGTSAVQNNLIEESVRIVSKLEEMGVIAASNKLELGTEQAIWSIKDIGLSYGYQREETGLNVVVTALANVGVESSLRKLGDAVDQAVWALKEVARYPITEGLENSISISANAFARLSELERVKVDKMIKELESYFGADETKRFNHFEKEYNSAAKVNR